MTYTKQIQDLWETDGARDLASILREILVLLDKAKEEAETVPLALELDIVLNANYALGFGGSPQETRLLADLYYRISQQVQDLTRDNLSESEVFSQLDLTIPHFHRLGCTVASASINILTSDEYHQENTAYDIISWQPSVSETSEVLRELCILLSSGLQFGSLSSWQLELFTFVLSLKLIYQDLTGDEFSTVDDGVLQQRLAKYISDIDQSSDTWSKFKDEWLEKSDYYRFVTLMMTQTTVAEELWIDTVKSYL